MHSTNLPEDYLEQQAVYGNRRATQRPNRCDTNNKEVDNSINKNKLHYTLF